MLYLKIGHIDGEIYSGSYFDAWGDNNWITSKFAKTVIKDIENGEVINENTIIIPVFGAVPPVRLSGGVKTLLTIYNTNDVVFRLSAMGHNCYKYLNYICNDKDVTLSTGNLEPLFNYGFIKIALLLNNGDIKYVTDNVELGKEFVKESFNESGEYIL